MASQWIKASPSLNRGILIINQLEETKFEQFLRRIIAKLKLQDAEIFSEDERKKLETIFRVNEQDLVLAIKTIVYIYKKMSKYIFMPADLKNDLVRIGLSNDKEEFMVKVWSNEIKETLNEIGTKAIDEQEDSLNFMWKLNAELSSVYQKKCKIPKAYLSLSSKKDKTEIELTHPELYSVFLQFEAIQNDLDNLS